MRILVTLLCLLVLNACSAISLGSLWSLRSVEAGDIDPVDARVGLAFSKPAPFDTASIEVNFTSEDGQTDTVAFDFEQVTDAAEIAAVGFPPDFPSVMLFKIPSEYIEDVRRLRDAVQQARDIDSGGNSLGISVSFKSDDDSLDCATDQKACEAMVRDLKIYSTIRVNHETGYIPLTKRSPITRLITQGKRGLCSA